MDKAQPQSRVHTAGERPRASGDGVESQVSQ